MTAGFEAFTEAGKLQFAATPYQSTFISLSKATYTSAADAGINGDQIGINSGGGSGVDFVAARVTEGYVEPSHLGTFAIGFPGTLYTDAPGRAVSFWEFKQIVGVNSIPINAVGLEVFNSTGSTAYHSDYKPFVVAVKIPVLTMNEGMEQFTALPEGRLYAAVLYGTSLRRTGVGDNAKTIAVRFSTAPMGVYVVEANRLRQSPVDVIGNGGVLIADVTGL